VCKGFDEGQAMNFWDRKADSSSCRRFFRVVGGSPAGDICRSNPTVNWNCEATNKDRGIYNSVNGRFNQSGRG